MKKLISGVLLLLALAGCSLLPVDKSRSESVRATEALAVESEKTIQRVLEVSPVQAMPAPHKGDAAAATPMREEVRVTSRTVTGAGSRSSAAGMSSVSVPLAVKLILLAVGLGLLWLVIWLWRRTSPAVEAAFSAGDRAVAGAIERLEMLARQTTNPEDLTKINAQLAALEKDRGRLASKKGVK